MTSETKSENTVSLHIGTGFLKGIVVISVLPCCLYYVGYYLSRDITEITDVKTKAFYVACFLIVCFVVWVVGRESVMTAIHAIKEIFKWSSK